MKVIIITFLLCFNTIFIYGQERTAIINVINMQNSPKTFYDKGLNAFFDLGSWMGFALSEDKNINTFSGPYILGLDHGVWVSNNFATLELIDNNGNSILKDLEYSSQTYLPGRLETQLQFSTVYLKSTLVFTSKDRAIISTKIRNNSSNDLTITPQWKGSIFNEIGSFSNNKDHLTINLDKGQKIYLSPISNKNFNVISDSNNYEVTFGKISLEAGNSKSFFFEIQYHPDQQKMKDPINRLEIIKSLEDNKLRWNKYIEITRDENLSATEKLVLTKSICTLINNWRSSAGELKHDGMFPSYHYKWFQGFWAWDSWKHAVAMINISPELAKNQVRAMYDYQNEKGMIADCIFRDTTIEQHNWRNTKPPLSSWAIWEIYKSTNDTTFLNEFYSKIVKYHHWWYTYRDYDKDGLCEYGSTDRSLIAAKWESGMDNAIRFDNCRIVEGTSSSINTESVDLNSYLAKEKEYLSKIAKVLNLPEQTTWEQEFKILSNKIRSNFYDDQVGYFFDINAESGEILNNALGPEGWAPIWCGIATIEQTSKVVERMMDPQNFNTKVPLPTVDISHPNFNPQNGYWRGPVWLDQVWFGLDGLKQYGYHQEAKNLTYKVINNCEGLNKPGMSIRENYHPLSGKGLNSEHFSWSAAHLILLIMR